MAEIVLTSDAGGASMAGRNSMVVMVIDVIDFSTSMEAAIDEGALAVYGAGTDSAAPPASINPFNIGRSAGLEARRLKAEVLIVAEPRIGRNKLRAEGIKKVIKGIESAEAIISGIVPNMGAETPKLAEMRGKIVVGATSTGGVAFDAAVCAGAPSVLTGTVARTMHKIALQSAMDSARRAVAEAERLGKGIALVAASGNSLEDVLAAEYIYKKILSIYR